ncbi:MAG: TIGR00296 family protein [Candidatus Diapherotrites archaeon]|nr:TIGR00296 family protein [Candidatus Diapherotrites archaeon]
MLSLKRAEVLVALSRKSISFFFEKRSLRSEIPSNSFLNEKLGVFVTLSSFPEKELRGCIGFAMPVIPLGKAVVTAALAAAFEDPRFEPLQKQELSRIVVEVSVLSKPQKFNAPNSQLPLRIIVGKHGLIVSDGFQSGLLLPQVPVEWGWSSLQFLEQCCLKAGLPKNAWKSESVKVEFFEAQVFGEERPEGKVVEEKLV